jgi:hypothetical protein
VRGLELLAPLRALKRMSVLLLVHLLVSRVPQGLLTRVEPPSYGKRACAPSTLLTSLAHVWNVFDAMSCSRGLLLPRLLGSLNVLDQSQQQSSRLRLPKRREDAQAHPPPPYSEE